METVPQDGSDIVVEFVVRVGKKSDNGLNNSYKKMTLTKRKRITEQ